MKSDLTAARMIKLLCSLQALEYTSLVIKAFSNQAPAPRPKTLVEVHANLKPGEWTSHLALTTFAKLFSPCRYFEIGVYKGASACCVVMAKPDIEIRAFDTWEVVYNGPPSSPEFVSGELKKCGFKGSICYGGDSRKLLPEQFADRFELLFVDGDHSFDCATRDLELAVRLCDSNGLIVLDDIVRSDLPLSKVWNNFKNKHSAEFVFAENHFRNGCGIAMKSEREN